MSDFITPNDRYTSYQMGELEFQQLLLEHAQRLFEGWSLFAWDPMLDSPAGKVKPDMLLIANDYSEWWVVEVELAKHPQSHFESQFPRLAEAFYLRDEVIAKAQQAADGMDRDLIAQMLKTVTRGMVCIADRPSGVIQDICRRLSFEHVVLEPFKSIAGEWGFREHTIPARFRSLESTDQSNVYELIVEDSIGSQIICVLPDRFPPVESFGLRSQGGDALTVKLLFRGDGPGEKRKVMVPAGLAAGRHSLIVRTVRLEAHLYELDD